MLDQGTQLTRRDELLSYIREHLQRDTSATRRAGITVWGIFAAVGWIMLELAQELAKLSLRDLTWLTVMAPFVLPVVWYLYEYCTRVFPVRYQSENNYRLAAGFNGKHSRLILYVQYLPLVAFPVLFLILNPYESLIAGRVAIMNTLLFGAGLFVALVVIASIEYLSRLFGEPLQLRTPSSKASLTLRERVLIRVFLMIYLTCNVVAVFESTNLLLATDSFWESIYAMTLVVASYVLLSILVNSVPNSSVLEDLQTLERDIVIHNMQSDEVVNNLERILLDYDASGWISRKRLLLKDFYRGLVVNRKRLLRLMRKLKYKEKQAGVRGGDEAGTLIAEIRSDIAEAFTAIKRTDEKYQVVFGWMKWILGFYRKLYSRDQYVLELIDKFDKETKKDFERMRRWNRRMDSIYDRMDGLSG